MHTIFSLLISIIFRKYCGEKPLCSFCCTDIPEKRTFLLFYQEDLMPVS